MNEVLQNVARIQREVACASEVKYPPPKIIAVTKTHSVNKILELKDSSVRDIGENRVQEIMEKLPELEKNTENEKKFQIHMIGRLQSNKVKYIIDSVCMIHSLDRMSLAEEINRQAVKKAVVMPVLVQVSPAGEVQKGGMAPGDVEQFIRDVAPMEGIRVCGLMAVMPNTTDEEYLSGLFRNMRQLFERIRDSSPSGTEISQLSMGMSGDYLLAAKYGATMVRIGSAIFGKRDYGNLQEDAHGHF